MPPTMARPFWRNPQTQGRPRYQRAAARDGRPHGDHAHLPGSVREFRSATPCDGGAGGATLLGSVCLSGSVGRSILRTASAACRPRLKVLSSGDLESEFYRSRQHDEMNEMSLPFFKLAGVPRQHIEACAVRRPGQGSRRQGERASRMKAAIVESKPP